jgi:hypothetical protein
MAKHASPDPTSTADLLCNMVQKRSVAGGVIIWLGEWNTIGGNKKSGGTTILHDNNMVTWR